MVRPQSPSSIELYNSCPQAYKFRYIDRLPELDFPHLQEGKAFHRVAADYIEHCFRTGQKTDFDRFTEIVRQALREVPYDLQEDFIGLCKSFVESHVLEADGAQVLVEHRLGLTREGTPCDFDDPDCLLRGIADLILIFPERICIVDYKTSWQIPPAGGRPPLQAEAYAALISKLHPGLEVDVVFDFVRWTAERRWTFSPEDADKAFRRIRRAIERISSDETFPPRVGRACSNCPFAHLCPELSRLSESPIPPGPIGPDEAVELARQYRALELRLRQLEEKLRDYCGRYGPIDLDDERLGFEASEVRSFPDPRPVVEILGKAGVPKEEIWGLLSLSRQKLERLLKRLKRPELQSLIEQHQKVEKRTVFRWRRKDEAEP